MCLLGCDDGSVRAIRIKKKEFIMEKQFSKTDCKIFKLKTNNFNLISKNIECKMVRKWK